MTITAGFAAAWFTWLGWPSPDRISARFTSLASVEADAWSPLGDDLRTRSARLFGANGLAVDLRVLHPGSDDLQRRPVAILLGGHRTGRDAVNLVGHPGGIAIVAIDYPYDGPERPRGVRQSLAAIPAARRALLDTPAAVALAVEWISSEPWADDGSIDLVGVSLGTQFAAPAATLEPRIGRVWFVQGGARNRLWLAHKLEDRIKIGPLRQAAAGLLWWLAHGASLAPEKWIDRISPRPVVVVGASDDLSLPSALVHALHDAARDPKRIVWTEGGHINPRRPETVRPLLDLIQPALDVGGRRDSQAESSFPANHPLPPSSHAQTHTPLP